MNRYKSFFVSMLLGCAMLLFSATLTYSQAQFTATLTTIEYIQPGDEGGRRIVFVIEDEVDITGSLEALVSKIFAHMPHEITLRLQPELTVDEFERLLSEKQLHVHYDEIVPLQTGGQAGSLGKPERNIIWTSKRDLVPAKNYQVSVGKRRYQNVEIPFTVLPGNQTLLKLQQSTIALIPSTMDILVDMQALSAQTDEMQRLRTFLEAELEARNGRVQWLREFERLKDYENDYLQYLDALNAYNQRYPFGDPCGAAQYDCEERFSLPAPSPLHYVIKISPRSTGDRISVSLQNTSQYLGQQHGRNVYHWTVYVNTDPATLERIESVTYSLHPTFRQNVLTISNSHNYFALSRDGWGEFEISAVLRFKNGKETTLTHWLKLR